MDKSAISKEKIRELLFIIALVVYMFITIMNASFYAIYYINKIFKVTIIIVSFLLVLKELLVSKKRARDWGYLLLVVIMTIIIYANLSGKYAILPLFLFIYSSRDINLNKIMKVVFYESLILFIFIVISAKLGLILNYHEYGSRYREYLGFRYSLYSQALLFNITAIYFYLYKDKTNFARCLLWFLFNYLIFRFTNSRLSFYLSIILIVGSLLINNKVRDNNLKKSLRLVFCLSYIICCICSLYFTFNYNPLNYKYNNANEFLGNRLYYGNIAMRKYGINITGHDIVLSGNGLNIDGTRGLSSYNYVDCLYVILLLRYGIVFMILFIGILTITCYYLYRKKEYYLLFVMMIFALHGIIDDLMIYLYYNTFWLVIGKMIINNNRIE